MAMATTATVRRRRRTRDTNTGMTVATCTRISWSHSIQTSLILLLVSSVLLMTDYNVSAMADYSRPNDTLSTLAFGSCHKRRAALRLRGNSPPIWNVIQNVDQPDAWLWTGDAVYPSRKDIVAAIQKEQGGGKVYSWKKYGPVPPSVLRMEYKHMLTSDTLGYNKFHPKMGIYGTWDDHDYGGNDMGNQMLLREDREAAFFDFLALQPPTQQQHRRRREEDDGTEITEKSKSSKLLRRQGVYNSVEWGQAPTKVKAINLDTRYHRDDHCIPGVAHRMPLGNGFACSTRWLTAGLHLERISWLWGKRNCASANMLGDEQWTWLEQELFESANSPNKNQDDDDNDNGDAVGTDAQVYVIVSSIQVLTTNPAMESWGHFPNEQRRLVELLNRRSATPYNTGTGQRPVVLLLSGDVHHAEFLGRGTLLEVTSSGLTHDCEESKIYGKLCRPLLENFDQHRYNGDSSSFYIGLNYGVIHMDWDKGQVLVEVKDVNGTVVLTSPVLPIGSRSGDDDDSQYTPPPYESLPPTWDGHLIPLVQSLVLAVAMAIGIARVLRTYLSG